MRKAGNRLSALCLAAVMVLSLLPTAALAAEGKNNAPEFVSGVVREAYPFLYPSYGPTFGGEDQAQLMEAQDAAYDGRSVQSPVKNQGVNGLCWAFGTYSIVEAYLKKQGQDVDFSELHMAYATSDRNSTEGDNPAQGWDRAPSDGGNRVYSAGYLMRGTSLSGTVDETEDPYTTELLGDRPLSDSEGKTQTYQVQNILFLTGGDKPTEYEVAAIKSYIVRSGGVGANMWWDSDNATATTGNPVCYDEANHAYYYSKSRRWGENNPGIASNHTVEIVGWDDGYSKEKFKDGDGAQPAHDGAWLVKNSWGEAWGGDRDHAGDGYFWISYEDTNFPTCAFCVDGAKPYDSSETVYETDYTSEGHATGYEAESAYFARVFTAQSGSEVLRSVRLMTVGPYEVEVDCVPLSALTGEYQFSSKGQKTAPYAGWYTVELSTPVSVGKMENGQFAVVVKLSLPEDSQENVVYMCYDKNGSNTIPSGEAYIGVSEAGLAETTYNFSIKAVTARLLTEDMVTLEDGEFTYTGEAVTPSITVEADGETLVAGTDYEVEYDNNLEVGEGTFTVTGLRYDGSVSGSFTIVPATLTAAGTGVAGGTYGDALSQLTVSGLTAKLGEKEVLGSWTLTGDSVPNVGDGGEYTAAFTPDSGGDNYKALTAPVTLNIAPADYTGTKTAETSARAGASRTYELTALLPEGATAGTALVDSESIFAQTPTVSGKSVTFTLKAEAAADSTGVITVPVTLPNYNDFELIITVKVADKDVPEVAADPITVTYTGEPVPDDAIQGTASTDGTAVDGTWSFAEGQALTNVTDSGAKTVVFTPTDGVNYAAVESTVTVTINKAVPAGTPTYTAVSASGKTLADAGLTAPAGWPEGSITWALEGDTEVTANTKYQWTFIPTDTDNYHTQTGELQLWVKSSSGTSGGGSSSGGATAPAATPAAPKAATATEVKENEDGSTTTTVTQPDGTVTETVTSPDGSKTEKVTDPEENVTITVTDPEGEVLAEVSIPATIPEPEITFVDVPEDHWAKDAINAMAGLGLVNGIGEDRYDTAAPMTRGALATVLHRLSSGKDSGYALEFADVDTDGWYAAGISWAAKTGVVQGIDGEGMKLFWPNDVITREQLAVMLCRYAKLIGLDTKAETESLNAFADSDSTGSWAVDGVAWCVANGILKGKGQNDLDPTANVSRAEVAVMLERFIALVK